jgi:hypothetical protein
LAKRKIRKTTPEEDRRWEENQRRLLEVIDRRLRRDGTTREEIEQRLGLTRRHGS